MALERPRYFTGQFLKEADFTLEQEYHKSLLRLHNRHLHTSGIADGMTVTHQANTLDVTISGGTAIDRQGRTIVLGADGHTLSFAGKTEGTWYVVVFFLEELAEETEETGVKDFTRMREVAKFEILNGPPSADSDKLALAKVVLEDTGSVTIKSVDESVRDLSGVASGESLVISRTPADMTGNQALRVDGDAYFTGNVGVGTVASKDRLSISFQSGDARRALAVDDEAGGQLSLAPTGSGVLNASRAHFGYNFYAKSPSQLTYRGGNNSASGVGFGHTINFWTADVGWGDHDFTPKPALTIENNGNVAIGSEPDTWGWKLKVQGDDNLVNIMRGDEFNSSGNAVFLELSRHDHDPPIYAPTYPSIRFHHGNRFWHRLEAREDGFHLKDGDIKRNDLYSGLTVKSLNVKGLFSLGTSKSKSFHKSGTGEIIVPLGNFRIGTSIQVEAWTTGHSAESSAMYHIACDFDRRPAILYQSGGYTMDGLEFFAYRNLENQDGMSTSAYFWARWRPGQYKPSTEQNNLYLNISTNTDWNYDDPGVWADASKHPLEKRFAIQYDASAGKGTTFMKGELSVHSVGINTFPTKWKSSSNKDLANVYETSTGGGAINIYDNAGNAKVIINGEAGASGFIDAGNFGIGTSAPEAKLDINGTMKVSGAIVSPEGTIRDDNGGWVRTYGQTGWYSQTYGGGWYMTDSQWIRSYGNRSIYHNAGTLRTDGTLQVGDNGGTLNVSNGGNFAYRGSVLFANTGGNVGIGTSAPGARLEVVSHGINSFPTKWKSSKGKGLVDVYETSTGGGALNIYDNAGAAKVIINGEAGAPGFIDAGNFGIGTSAPEAKLDINGTMKVSGAIVSPEGTIRDDNGGWVRTYGQTGWYSQTYGGGWYMTDSQWIRSYGNRSIYHNAGTLRTDGTLQVGDNGGTLNVSNNGNFAYRGSVLFANTAGHIGVGTNSPVYPLHVTKSFSNNWQVLLNNGNANLYLNHSGGYGMYLDTGQGNSSGRYAMVVRNASQYHLYVRDDGMVGVGTTSPGAKLHVAGDVKVTGNLLGAAKDTAGSPMRVRSGKTPESNTNWIQYGSNGLYADVDISSGGFTTTPVIIANLAGNSGNWEITGGGSPYNRTKSGFRIFVKAPWAVSPTSAKSWKWHIQWIAVGV